MNNIPRVALFADTFYETNGAANVLRKLQSFAKANSYPFLCICAGDETKLKKNGVDSILELKRSKVSFPIDGKLKYDPFFWRHKSLIKQTLNDFKPDVIHLTGLNDVSQVGFYLSHQLSIKTVASWHTNTHEYAAQRLMTLMKWLPKNWQSNISQATEKGVLRGLMKLHSVALLQLAPNEELVQMIRKMTNRPTFLMSRGVDLELFSPEKRCRKDDTFVIGYVGRLRPEKNVRFLAEIDDALQKAGLDDYKFVVVGEGNDGEWLEKNLSKAELKGVLHGEALAQAYANMDLFVFPSMTDAFGNVVLEAMAAGVPAVVMPEGGPKFLINHKHNGYVASSTDDFIGAVVEFVKNRETIRLMKKPARDFALTRSWENVFDQVYRNYRLVLTLDKSTSDGFLVLESQ